MFVIASGCSFDSQITKKIIFLHHSTGKQIWLGGTNKYVNKFTGKSDVMDYFNSYNRSNKTDYRVYEQVFPKEGTYGWKNYPFDYYNIWVKNGGYKPYLEEPTLEILTKQYDVIIFKHCYPVSQIIEDTGSPDIDSEEKRLENYKLQYQALKSKMKNFSKNKFIVWTPAVHVKGNITVDQAVRTREFRDWIVEDWDEKGDNIYCWDFYSLETEGGLYLCEEYAAGRNNSHPNAKFAAKAAVSFSKFIIDVIESRIE